MSRAVAGVLPIVAAGQRPAPFFPDVVQAGEYVHTSTIYPADPESGLPAGPNPKFPHFGNSAVTRQSEQVFDSLERMLEAAGSSLANVLKCEVLLADSSDFYEFNLVWQKRFPSDPPARTTLEVGDMQPIPGVLIALQAIALKDDSSLEREVIFSPQAPDSLSAEHCAQAVRAGDYVFCSAFPAIVDYGTGILPVRDPIHSVVAAQTELIMENLNHVLAVAGTSLEHTIKTHNLMVRPLADAHDWPKTLVASPYWSDINRVWDRYMKQPPPPRTSVAVQGAIVPGACNVVNATVLVPSSDNRKEDVRPGVRFDVSERAYNYSPAVQTKDYLIVAGHVAINYNLYAERGWEGALVRSNPRMPHLTSDVEVQTDYTMEDRVEILQANGLGLDDIFEVKVWLNHPRRDYRGFERAWRRWFPDPDKGPVVNVIPTTGIHYTTLVEIDFAALRNA